MGTGIGMGFCAKSGVGAGTGDSAVDGDGEGVGVGRGVGVGVSFGGVDGASGAGGGGGATRSSPAHEGVNCTLRSSKLLKVKACRQSSCPAADVGRAKKISTLEASCGVRSSGMAASPKVELTTWLPKTLLKRPACTASVSGPPAPS
eukprot:scaffold227_cov309-Prasinococcus_capsulatus_cf.AAC.1